MTLGSATVPQLIFGALCAITGIVGTWMQVAGQRYAQRGGPRESPVLARLGGQGSPWDQLIFINDRGAVAAFGAMLGNAGAAVLFASVVAGLTINFPGIWPVGATLYALVIVFGAGRIVMLGSFDLWQTRVIQEWMFERLPMDSTIAENAPAKATIGNTYRADTLALKPDLAEVVQGEADMAATLRTLSLCPRDITARRRTTRQDVRGSVIRSFAAQTRKRTSNIAMTIHEWLVDVGSLSSP